MANPGDILREVELRAEKQFGGKARLSLTDKIKNGRLTVDQGIIAGCAGGMYDNIAEAAAILKNRGTGSGYFSLSVYPPSVPVNLELIQSGIQQSLLESGALFRRMTASGHFSPIREVSLQEMTLLSASITPIIRSVASFICTMTL